MSLTNEQIRRILNDRVQFKIYASEQHLNRLNKIAGVFGDNVKDAARMEVEIDVDCFLSQLVGAVDSLLFQINERLDLGIPADRVNFANVQSSLSAKTKKIDLLSGLDEARQHGNWYAVLSELKNKSSQRNILKLVPLTYESPKEELSFLKIRYPAQGSDDVFDLDTIPYLENSLQQVKNLISQIRAQEPLLQP